MNIRKAFIATITSFIALSCVTSPIDEVGFDNSISNCSVTLSLTKTRTQLGEKCDGLYPLYWSNGDRISVNGIESAEAIIDAKNRACATFALPKAVEGVYNVAYPAAPEGQVIFAENQLHTANGTFGPNVTTMYGVGTSESVELNHLTGVLKIGIVGSATLQKVKIMAADQAPIAGAFDIDFQTGKVTPTSESSCTINYSFGTGVKLNATTPTYIHIAVPAGAYPSLNVRLYDSNGGIMSKTIKAPSSKPLTAGIVREFTTLIEYKADSTSDVEIGKPLPLWSEGYLDIHFINSASGECAFYVMPDGTTMVVDVGELSPTFNADTRVPFRPSAEVRPYITYANYIKHFIPEGMSAIDYCHISHFHIDHFGDHRIEAEISPVGYRKIGAMALYDEIPFNNILDRAYPDYIESSNVPAIADSMLMKDWRLLIRWGEKNLKFTAARFKVGTEQIRLLYKRSSYPNFRIFNIIGNGYGYYLVDGTLKVKGAKSDPGNPASCGFHLSYGKFDYISCGDLTGAPQNRMAYYFRDCMNGKGIDAFKAHHHLSSNGWGGQMRANKFNPQVVLNQNFYKKQPDPGLTDSLLHKANMRNIFTSNAHPDAITENADIYNDIAAYNGHIVLRVAPGGEEFYVYMLDDSDFDYRVKSVHGPYTSN